MKSTIDTQILESMVNPNLILLIKEIIKSEIMQINATNKETNECNNKSMQEIELMTIKDCTKLVPGISEYTVRELIQRGDIQHFRTGQGKHGKILVYKQSFLDYFVEKGGVE